MAVIAAEDASRLFVARSRWRWEETAFWLAAAASYFLFPGHLVLITQALIAGLFAVSLDLLLGYSGIASMGHAAFFGVGAYTAGLLAKYGWGDPILGLAAAALLTGALGALCSLLVARLHGIAMLMVTLGIAASCYEVANRWRDLTGGDDGLQGMVVQPIFGVLPFDFDGHVGFAYALAVVFALYLAARRLVNSPFGLALLGIRENARRVPALGIGVRAQLMLAFTIAAAMAGIAGALLAETTQFIALEVLSFDRSVSVLIMLVLGGIGNLIGGMVGAMVFIVARDELAALDPVYWNFWMGLILAAIVLSGSGGIIGLLRRIERRLGRVR